MIGSQRRIVVSGGAGFIGSAVIRMLLGASDAVAINLDKLTYAADLAALEDAASNPRYCFERLDVCDRKALSRVFARHQPDGVIHLAAESHVDRSIDGPAEFVRTNVLGSFAMLEAALEHWRRLDPEARARFRFVHVSTDEVFGALGATGRFSENTAYRPNSPYSATKAAGDHLARAWHETYGLPVVVSNATNNYGPYQFPEKLIPLTIVKALAGRPIPIYGAGENVRDWLHVDDHARALLLLLGRGRPGESYGVGGESERRNIDVVRAICAALDDLHRRDDGRPYAELISFVTDRPGHDFRYAMDTGKLRRELAWSPSTDFSSGLRATVAWYLANRSWWQGIVDRGFRGERVGLLAGASSPRRARLGDR